MGESGQLPTGRQGEVPPIPPLPPGVRQPDPTLGRVRPVPPPGRLMPPAGTPMPPLPPAGAERPSQGEGQPGAAKPIPRKPAVPQPAQQKMPQKGAAKGGAKAAGKAGAKARSVAGKAKNVAVKPRKRAPLERMAAPAPMADIDPPTRPKRQRVVLADRPQAGRAPSLRARVELAQQTSWGELLIRDLIRAQLRSAVGIGLLVLLLLGALPALFAVLPSFASFTLAGVPLAWLVLGVLPFPVLFLAGLAYNRLAERHERAFVDMIEN